MEKNKSEHASLETKKALFLQTGFIIALALVLLAFEWRTPDREMPNIYTLQGEDVELLLPVNTVHLKPLPPPPAPQPAVIIKEIGNDVMDPLDDFTINVEIDPEDAIPDIFILPEEPEDQPDDTPFIVAEDQPEFPGGLAALYRYLGENIRYPENAKEAGIEGTVFVNFIVERDGSVSQVTVLRSPHPFLSDEAVRVISSMPVWIPGKQREKPVRVSMNLPVKFVLE